MNFLSQLLRKISGANNQYLLIKRMLFENPVIDKSPTNDEGDKQENIDEENSSSNNNNGIQKIDESQSKIRGPYRLDEPENEETEVTQET